jgi:hypothetical protein
VIIQEVAAIPPEMTRRVMERYRERLNQCIDNEGSHLSDAVFKFQNCIKYTIKDLRKYLAWFGSY